jgi:hypothetical protein
MEISQPASETIWLRLYEAAQENLAKGVSGASARIETLDHLKEMCDAILSGEAIKEAERANISSRPFLAKRVVEKAIIAFNGMRKWKGPHPVTIRKADDLRSYVARRNEESLRGKPSKPNGPSSRHVDIAIDTIPDMDNRDLVRRRIEEGRRDKAALDSLLHLVGESFGIDLDTLPGKILTKNSLKNLNGGLAEEDTERFRKLVLRLTDNDGYLNEFDLVFRAGRLKMSIAPSRDLIFPEEMSMLARLGRIKLAGEGDEPTPA